MELTLNQLRKIVAGKYYGDASLLKKTIKNISINSNAIKKNDLFIGIKGEKFNGDDFAKSAIKNGALAAVISCDIKELENKIIVKNGREALGKIAQYWKAQSKLHLVAITGSNGKTTTKEMIGSILTFHIKSKLKVLMSQ